VVVSNKPEIDEQLEHPGNETNRDSKKSEIQLENSTICQNSMKISPRLSEIDHTKTSESLEEDCSDKNEIFQNKNSYQINTPKEVSPSPSTVTLRTIYTLFNIEFKIDNKSTASKSPNSIGMELIKKSQSDLELRDKDRDAGVIQVSIETKFDNDPRKLFHPD